MAKKTTREISCNCREVSPKVIVKEAKVLQPVPNIKVFDSIYNNCTMKIEMGTAILQPVLNNCNMKIDIGSNFDYNNAVFHNCNIKFFKHS